MVGDKIVPYEENSNSGETEQKRIIEGVALASDLGFSIGIPIAGGAFLGSVIDKKLHTSPSLTLLLLFLGILVSFIRIFDIVRNNSK